MNRAHFFAGMAVGSFVSLWATLLYAPLPLGLAVVFGFASLFSVPRG